MIPIGDVNPRQRFPVITVAIILLNVLVFLYGLTLSQDALQQLYLSAGVVPYDLTHNFGAPSASDLLTSMFLHGGWLHIISNMLYLWIFGDNVEDLLGKVGFLAFYLLAGVLAALTQVVVAPTSPLPIIGASGAIAGVLGAYIVLYPKARVRTLVIFFRFARLMELPALVVLGLWFVLQFLSGIASIGATSGGGTAWFAHLGGFVIGCLIGWFVKRGSGKRSSPSSGL